MYIRYMPDDGQVNNSDNVRAVFSNVVRTGCDGIRFVLFFLGAIGDVSSSHILTIGINADGCSLRLLGT